MRQLDCGIAFCVLALATLGLGQQKFSTPGAATQALAAAAAGNNVAALQQLFGPGGADVVSSGDAAEDKLDRQQFAEKYRQMHRLVHEPDGTTLLYVGAENWPFPIPLADHNGQWSFDTAAGKQEVLARRVGRNENDVIATCQQLVAAQKQYFSTHHQYAQHFVSDPGQENGLFWASSSSHSPESPIGPLLAFASLESGAKTHKTPTPFEGYFFHVLHTSNPQEFAFIAYPADYRSSGVMTFLVNQNGQILQKDLGSQTPTLAPRLSSASASGWNSANEPD